MNPTPNFPILTGDRYLTAVDKAKEQVRKRIRDEVSNITSTYSPQFRRNVLIVLALLTVFSFVISAGKQAAAAGLVLDDLPTKFNHLSALWSNVSIAFMLLLGEIGSITFMVVSGVVGEVIPKTTIRGQEVSIPRWILRSFAGLCASYAIVANVTITLLDPIGSVALLQWLMSVGIPVLVLGVAYMLELIIIGDMKSSNEKKVALAHPEIHDYFKRSLFDCLYAEMTRLKEDRKRIGELVILAESDQSVKRWLVSSEYHAHQDAASFDLSGAVNPFLSQGDPTIPEIESSLS